MREIVIDTETTGLNYKAGDRIIEEVVLSYKTTFDRSTLRFIVDLIGNKRWR